VHICILLVLHETQQTSQKYEKAVTMEECNTLNKNEKREMHVLRTWFCDG
jgi:hypothetical protein